MSELRYLVFTISSPKFGTLSFQSEEGRLESSPLRRFGLTDDGETLPHATVELEIRESHGKLTMIDKEDRVEIRMITDQADRALFKGEVTALDISYDEERRSAHAEVIAFTSFIRFQQFFIGPPIPFRVDSLRNFIEVAAKVSDLRAEIVVDDDVDDRLQIGSVINLPIMTVLNHIALERNLVIEIDGEENSMRIANRATRGREERERPIPTLSHDQIRNFKKSIR